MTWMLNCSECGGWVGIGGDPDIFDGEVGWPACAKCVRSRAWPFGGYAPWGVDITVERWMRYKGSGVWMLQPDYDLPFVQQRRQRKRAA